MFMLFYATSPQLIYVIIFAVILLVMILIMIDLRNKDEWSKLEAYKNQRKKASRTISILEWVGAAALFFILLSCIILFTRY